MPFEFGKIHWLRISELLGISTPPRVWSLTALQVYLFSVNTSAFSIFHGWINGTT